MWRLFFCLACLPLAADNLYLRFHENEYGRYVGYTKKNGTEITLDYDEEEKLSAIVAKDWTGYRNLCYFTYDKSHKLIDRATYYKNSSYLKRTYTPTGELASERIYLSDKTIFNISYEYSESCTTIIIPRIGQLVYYPDRVERYSPKGNFMYSVPLSDEINLIDIDPEETAEVPTIDESTYISYDTDGRVIRKQSKNGVWDYKYDDFDRIIEVIQGNNSIEYFYDPLGRRIAKITRDRRGIVDKEYYIFLGVQEIASMDENYKLRSLRIPHIPIVTKVIAPVSIELKGKRYTPTYDKIGRLRKLDDHEYYISPFGRELQSSENAPECPWTFAFHRTDYDTGLTFFGPRSYDPEALQWFTPDPYGCVDGPDPHVYCKNAPLQYIDPYGTSVSDVIDAMKDTWDVIGAPVVKFVQRHVAHLLVRKGLEHSDKFRENMPIFLEALRSDNQFSFELLPEEYKKYIVPILKYLISAEDLAKIIEEELAIFESKQNKTYNPSLYRLKMPPSHLKNDFDAYDDYNYGIDEDEPGSERRKIHSPYGAHLDQETLDMLIKLSCVPNYLPYPKRYYHLPQDNKPLEEAQ